MEARFFRVAATVAIMAAGCCIPAYAAGVRTQNFIIEADTPQFAEQTAQWAEKYRRDLAIQWLGKELPPWREPCPIRVVAGPNQAAQGETSFVFDQRGVPGRWSMTVIGSHERVLDAVLPHEITHTIFATHFGRPLPRWADEGACTTVEHQSERVKHEQNLIRYLKSDRGIAFNKMFVMKQYPSDILPLYAQGYSVARYMILQGGCQKYVKFLEDGLAWNNWNAAVEKHYGFRDLSDLQVTWVAWVGSGSPTDLEPRQATIALASTEAPVTEGIATPQAPRASAARTEAAPAQGSPIARLNDLAMTPDGGSIAQVQGANGSPLQFYPKQRQLYVSRVGEAGIPPMPDNRRPETMTLRDEHLTGERVPPNLPHTNPAASNASLVETLPQEIWAGPGVTAAAPTRTADVRADFGVAPKAPTAPSALPRLVPIDPPSGGRYDAAPTGTLLR